MESIILNNKDIKALKRVRVLHSRESVIYRKDGEIYKILIPIKRSDNRKKIITNVNDNPIENMPTPHILLLNEDENFIGYSMNEFTGFKTVEESQAKDKYDNNIRRQISLDTFRTVREIVKKGYLHCDLNRFNILLNGINAKIIDLDGLNVLNDNPTEEDIIKFDCLREIMIADGLYTMINYIINKKNGLAWKIDDKKYQLYNVFPKGGIIRDYINGYFHFTIRSGVTPEEIINAFDEETVDKFYFALTKKKS